MILVTGSSGFIGSHLMRALGNECIGIDRKEGFEINEYKKLHNLFETHEIDTIFHLAANSDISIGLPNIEFEDTLYTTILMLQHCYHNGVKRFVFASSSAVYGSTDDLIMENYGPLIPISHYGAAKLASEAFICSYAYQYGIQAYILRFPNVVGEGATHGVVLDLIKRLISSPKRLDVLGTGEQLKPYIHVSELIDAILFILEHAKDQINVYNISGIGRTTVKDIAEMIVENSGYDTEIVYTGKSWPGDCQNYKFNIQKLIHLGWEPKMNSNEAIKKAIKSIWKEYTPEVIG